MKAFKSRQLWVAKHFSGWAGSGTMMHKWKQRDTPICHKCEENETTLHVVQCQSASNLTTYTGLRKGLKIWLKKTTSLAIMTAVLLHLDAYQKKENTPIYRRITNGITISGRLSIKPPSLDCLRRPGEVKCIGLV